LTLRLFLIVAKDGESEVEAEIKDKEKNGTGRSLKTFEESGLQQFSVGSASSEIARILNDS
jgi:hypothetical protein